MEKVENTSKILHDGGFAHGDLQASNIMVSTDMKQMKIVDFDWGGPDGKVFLLATLFLGIMMLSVENQL